MLRKKFVPWAINVLGIVIGIYKDHLIFNVTWQIIINYNKINLAEVWVQIMFQLLMKLTVWNKIYNNKIILHSILIYHQKFPWKMKLMKIHKDVIIAIPNHRG